MASCDCSLFEFLNDETQKEKLRQFLAKEENADDIEIRLEIRQGEINHAFFPVSFQPVHIPSS